MLQAVKNMIIIHTKRNPERFTFPLLDYKFVVKTTILTPNKFVAIGVRMVTESFWGLYIYPFHAERDGFTVDFFQFLEGTFGN